MKLAAADTAVDELLHSAMRIDDDASAVGDMMHGGLGEMATITLYLEHETGERERGKQTGSLK